MKKKLTLPNDVKFSESRKKHKMAAGMLCCSEFSLKSK